MILGFKEFFDTKKYKPTYFKDKILLNVKSSSKMFFFDGKVGKNIEITRDAGESITYNVYSPGKPTTQFVMRPKLHTIREDKHDRWKAGMTIQMVYRGANYKIKSWFNKDIPELSVCKSVQKIEIKWNDEAKTDVDKLFHSMGMNHRDVEVFIDDNLYFSARFIGGYAGNTFHGATHWSQIECPLFHNDGFENLFDFFEWFNEDFKGKIIHFTDLRY